MSRIPYEASLLLAILLSGLPAGACGDKLLIIGRGVRFHSRPASILGFAPPGSHSSAVIGDPAFQSAIRKAGHRMRIVKDPGELEEALKIGQYDIVVAEISDAANVEGKIPASASGTVILPVVHEGTKAEIRTVEQRYHCVLTTPAKSGDYLWAIDQAMELVAKRSHHRTAARS